MTIGELFRTASRCEPMPKQPLNDNASYFEFEVMRGAFQRWVVEDKVPEDQWRPRATKLVRIVTGDEYVDPNIVEWMISNKHQR